MSAGHDDAALQGPVGVIAGGGALPFAVARALTARGLSPVVFGLRGICDVAPIAAYHHHWIGIGQLGRLMRRLKSEGCRDIAFIGSVTRPALSDLSFDWGGLRLLPEIAAAMRGGDDHLLSSGARMFERRGFRIRGVSELAPDLVMPEGLLTRALPDAKANSDIAIGVAVLAATSRFDIGQAVVVIDGHVVAIEGIEGTDAMLARVAQLRADGRLRKVRDRGVMVKTPKTGQDLRLDLPTIGSRTVTGIADAGLAGLAVQAGGALAADLQDMVVAADKAGLFVLGYSA